MPAHAYSFRVAAVGHGGDFGPSSLPSSPVATRALGLSAGFAAGAPQVTALDSHGVRLSWAGSAPQDTGGLPLLGVLVVRELLFAGRPPAPDADAARFGHHVVLPALVVAATDPASARRERRPSAAGAQQRAPSALVEATGGSLLGLFPNTSYRFAIAPITALGVGPLTAPSAVIHLPPLAGRLLAVLPGRGRIAIQPSAAACLGSGDGRSVGGSADDNACEHGVSGFDATHPALAAAPEADRLAVLAQLHAAVSVSHAHIAGQRRPGVPRLRASRLLERSGLGEGALDPQLDLATAATSALKGRGGSGAEGIGHALNAWVGRAAYANAADSGVETLSTGPERPRSGGGDLALLLPGLGGRARFQAVREARVRAAVAAAASSDAGGDGGDGGDGGGVSSSAGEMGSRRRLAPADPFGGDDASWHDEAAYWAMATGKTAQFVRRLAATYDALPPSAGASLRGLTCENGVCRSPAAVLLREQLLSEMAGAPMPARRASAAETGLELPCVSPLVAVMSSRQAVVVFAPPPGGGGVNASSWTIAAWVSAWSPAAFNIEAEAVAASPFAGARHLDNAHDAPGRILLVERGPPLPLAQRVKLAAEAGAAAVVIVDDGAMRCGTAARPNFSQDCVWGSGMGDGFAAAARTSEQISSLTAHLPRPN